jgi:predicted site-specific integrase-resolvase
MRVAIYARVSTDDRGQDPENQLIALREWCARSGHEIAAGYIEHESGREGTERRRQFAKLFEDSHRRQFDLVLFWALDRFSREGMVQTILHLQRLAAYGVAFHSYTEPHLATDTSYRATFCWRCYHRSPRSRRKKSPNGPMRAWNGHGAAGRRSAGPGWEKACGRKSHSASRMAPHPLQSHEHWGLIARAS